jgi:hypothetical protein
MLDKYGLVTVHLPKGKHAFAAIGFPGFFGCVSGINDAGLALAVHEVYLSKDKAPMFNPKGVPYSMCVRRILEECTCLEEAEKLLRSTERTTLLSLAACDRRGRLRVDAQHRGGAPGRRRPVLLHESLPHARTDHVRLVPPLSNP